MGIKLQLWACNDYGSSLLVISTQPFASRSCSPQSNDGPLLPPRAPDRLPK